MRTFIGVADVAQSQDCLYLNVWTPSADAGRRPVMVWFHGGAFILGSGSTLVYDGSQLAREGDVVVVTCNYRLGALGYLNWRSLAADSGHDLPDTNLGLRDQIGVLEWVREHIECFGGDPENVTIFGESAGGMSVGTLLGTPRARGLFHRAILQSGAAHNVATPEQASAAAQHFFSTLGVERPTLDALQELPVAEIMGAQLRTTTELGLLEGILPFQPSVDDDVLPEHPLEAIRKGSARDLPVLVGHQPRRVEALHGGRPPGHRPERGAALPALRARALAPGRPRRTISRSVRSRPTTGSGGRAAARSPERWAAFQSDRIFHYPASRLADLQCMHSDQTYAYLFEWSPPADRRAPRLLPRARSALRVRHAAPPAASGPSAW